MIYITYYTKNSIYEEGFKSLFKSSAQNIALNYCAEEIGDMGNWYKNTAYKSKFILKMLNEYGNNLVWVDCDAEFKKNPILFNGIDTMDIDIAFHYLEWKTWYGYKNDKTKELLTGTMYLRNNEKIKQLLEEWFNEAEKTNEWEQKVLQRIIGKYDLKIYELPIEYCYIKTLPDGREPLVKCDPVIVHHQYSRIAKRRKRV